MKKYKLLFLIILLMIPVYIKAASVLTYSKAVETAEGYIKKR